MDRIIDFKATVPGYHLIQQLYCSSKTFVYRALRQTNSPLSSLEEQPTVIIKLPAKEFPSFSELLRFRNYYTITKTIQHSGIIRPHRLEFYGNRFALVLEDFAGISLQQYVQRRSLPFSTVLEIMVQLAEILDTLYRHRIIHKQIQPGNILINPQTQKIQLIDFSMASVLPKETQELQIPNSLEGTLEYLSPEQTGRMNRGIDYRSDFYSFGITFYQLLTGQLPFQSADAMELVHCHLAKPPTAPHLINPDIPPILSSLVLKLMAKDAEDRYQNPLGLQHDLEICLDQLRKNGQIEFFELGGRDLCDRFLISEKLYGRQAEVQTLLAAFERVSAGDTEMMLITGDSGIGKTAIVNEVHKPIVRQRGYFISGKFDQFQRYTFFSGFVTAFQDLIQQLLSESDTQLAEWKHQILANLGENAQVIMNLIPELEQIIGPQPPVPELSGNAAQNRFNLLLQKFVQLCATKDHPLVIFLDDLQWADSGSLQLIQLLLGTSEIRYLLFIGAYRNSEIYPTHPLTLALNELQEKQGILKTITIQSLNILQVNHLIADTLNCTPQIAFPLTKLVYQKTEGNPFFTIQFLKALYEAQLITFNQEQGYWQCDIAQVQAKALTTDVVNFMAQQLQKLPVVTQNALKFAACIGNHFDLETLTIVWQQSPNTTATALWPALQAGLILPAGEVYKFYQAEHSGADLMTPEAPEEQLSLIPIEFANYKFLHDRVQQAAYSLIPEAQKQFTHLKIGQRLLKNSSNNDLDNNIFEIVNQLNDAGGLITDPLEREQLVKLNLMAGRKAKATTAYYAALEYLKIGIKFLPSESWRTQYSLTLTLYEEAIEAAYLWGDFAQMEEWKDILLSEAIALLDQVKTYEVQIAACVAQNKLRDAIAIALSVLSELGINFPTEPTPIDWQRSIQEVTQNLANKPVSSALDLPLMQDRNSQAALQILLSIDAPAYLCFPEILPLTICQEVNLSLTFGNLPESAKAYANYGLILCSGLGDLETGYEFGQLALKLLEKHESEEIYARTSFLVNFLIRHWKEPLRHTLKSLQDAYTKALGTGDLLHGAIAAEKYCYHAYFAGEPLPILAQQMKNYAHQMVQLKQDVALRTHEIHWQSVLNLIGSAQDPCLLIGEACNETIILPQHLADNTRTALYYLYFNKLFLCYLFNDYQRALNNAKLTAQYLDGANGQYISSLFYWYDSLTQLAVYQESSQMQQNEILNKVAANQQKMWQWSQCAPMNFQHKYDLVEAERHRVLGQKNEAIEYYDIAIKGARKNEYLQEEALANERAAKFYFDWGKEKIAQSYLSDAYFCYQRWGAKAKIDHLEKCYPKLCNQETLAALDFAALSKASQTLYQEIHLDKLLTILLQTVMANAGASKGVLMLLWNQHLRVEAVIELEAEPRTLQGISVDESADVPISLIYAVKHSFQTLVIDDATKDTSLIADSYMIQHQPKSLLCTPILNQGQLIGILYLENHQTAGAFPKDRVKILNLICSQAAISLANSRLYEQLKDYSHQLELKVSERTAELEKANQELYRMATIDGLTFVANRRYFDVYLQEKWHQFIGTQKFLGLLLCDIDYFKCYNDYYGHQAGDECLKKVANLLSQLVKESNHLVARYGGEEFAIILSDTEETEAIKVAEQAQKQMKIAQFPHARSPVAPYITVSIGVSCMMPAPDNSWNTLIAIADQALYRAKKAGRDRYCL